MTEGFAAAMGLATLAGLSVPVGAWLASFDRLVPGWLREELRHSIIAFGGGALMSAVALVLVPEGAEHQGAVLAVGWFMVGGVIFALIDRAIARSGGAGAQLIALLLDYIPEAMALGALVSGEFDVAVLMAVLIALQNIPEGFNAYRELDAAPGRSPHLFRIFVFLVPVGPVAAFLGLTVLSAHPEALAAIMLLAAGGIFYLVFEDIAPQVPLERSWAPPLGAVAGFALGLAGHLAAQ